MAIYDAAVKCSEGRIAWDLSLSENLDTNKFKSAAPLHLASRLEYEKAAKLLLRCRPYDSIYCSVYTPLAFDCSFGHVSTAQLLVDSGTGVLTTDYFNRILAMLAARNGCYRSSRPSTFSQKSSN